MKNIKPSELILLALKDLEVVESMPETYGVNMGVFHDRLSKDRCFVCLAGAVMAITLHANPQLPRVATEDFPEAQRLLYALNMFRIGSIEQGLAEMKIPLGGLRVFFPVVPYTYDPTEFKSNMRAMADYLETKGL